MWPIITRQRDGWEWSGCAFSHPGKVWNEFLPAFEKHKNQPLESALRRRGEAEIAGPPEA